MAEQRAKKQYTLNHPKFQPGKRTKAQRSFFFLHGKLYRIVTEDRPRAILRAWDFADEKIREFNLLDVKKHMKNAYDTAEVSRMINRNRPVVQTYITKGVINEPARVFSYGMNKYGYPFTKMKWSEEDILALHEYLMTSGSGRPRGDGTMYPAARLPSRQELLAMLRSQTMFYMQTSDGSMIPVWKSYNEI